MNKHEAVLIQVDRQPPCDDCKETKVEKVSVRILFSGSRGRSVDRRQLCDVIKRLYQGNIRLHACPSGRDILSSVKERN